MECSGVGAEVHTECIPTDVDVETAVCGGEDYELLLTVDAGCCDKLREDYNARFGDELHVIGRIVGSADGRIVWLDNGRRIAPRLAGLRALLMPIYAADDLYRFEHRLRAQQQRQ